MEDESLKIYFSEAQWNSLTAYEKNHFKQVKRNYDVLINLGLNPKLPKFMKTVRRIEKASTKTKKDAVKSENELQLPRKENGKKCDSKARTIRALEHPNESSSTEKQESLLKPHKIKKEDVSHHDPCSISLTHPVNGENKFQHHADNSEFVSNHPLEGKPTEIDKNEDDKWIFDCQIKIEPADEDSQQDDNYSEVSSTRLDVPPSNGIKGRRQRWKHNPDTPESGNSANGDTLVLCPVNTEKSDDVPETNKSSEEFYAISGINLNGSKIKYFHCIRCTFVCGPRAGRQKGEGWGKLDENESNGIAELEVDASSGEGKIQKVQKPFKCPHCDHRSNRARNLRCHIETKHIGKKPYKCELCDYRASQRTHVKKHLDAIHFGLKRYRCAQCDYAASQIANLELHILSAHQRVKPFKCHICDYGTVRSHDLKAHVEAVHSGIKRFKCMRCEFRTAHEGSVRRHMKDVHYKKELNGCAEISEVQQEC